MKGRVVLCHVTGRLTAPIMWFFIAEGCHYTRNMKAYAKRLLFILFLWRCCCLNCYVFRAYFNNKLSMLSNSINTISPMAIEIFSANLAFDTSIQVRVIFS